MEGQEGLGELQIIERLPKGKDQLALKYLDCKLNYETALIKSNETVELAKVKSNILIHTEKEHSRTIEGRILAISTLSLGSALAYKTYETTEPLRMFFTTIVEIVKPSLYPNWQSLLLNEKQWVVGYAASGVNQLIRLFLVLGVSAKKILLLILQTSDGIISLGGMTAALFVLFVFVVFSGLLLKLYISDVFITPISLKVNKN